MTTPITHQVRAARRANVYNNAVNYILNAEGTVKVNSLYTLIGDEVFSSNQYFIRSFIDMAANDSRIEIFKTRKGGTFAVKAGGELVIPQLQKKVSTGKRGRPVSKRVVEMGGHFGTPKVQFVGKAVKIEVEEGTWNQCKKVPKTFAQFADTVEVYRRDFDSKPSQYLTITPKRQYLFAATV